MPCSNLLMVHGAQGTLNHLEPPSESEPLSTAAGDDLDPGVAQQEGEHKPGSGDEGLGGNDHDDEAAVVEDTADAKEIPTQIDGAEDSNQSIAISTPEADPNNLDADEKPETSSSEEIDSTQIPDEKEIEDQTENASPPQVDTISDNGAEPNPSGGSSIPVTEEDDGATAHPDQLAVSAEESQLPAQATEDVVSKEVVDASPELQGPPTQSLDEGVADSAEADAPLPAVVSETQSTSVSPEGEDGSETTHVQPVAEVSEAKDGRDELQDTSPGTPTALDAVQHGDEDSNKLKAEGQAEPENIQDPEALAPILDTDNSINQDLPQSQGEAESDEPQEAQSDESDDVKTEIVQATADESTIDSSVADQSNEAPFEVPAQALETSSSIDNVNDIEQSQPSDDIEASSAAPTDAQATSIQDEDTEPAALYVPTQSDEAAPDIEANSVHQDALEDEMASSELPGTTTNEDKAVAEVSEASEPEKSDADASTADHASADAVEVPEKPISNLLPDQQKPDPLEPSQLHAVEQEGEDLPDSSSVVEDAPSQIGPEVGGTEDAAEPHQDVSGPEEQLPGESTKADDAEPSLADPERVESGDILPASDQQSGQALSEAPSADHDDSGVNLETTGEASAPESGSKDVEEQAVAPSEPARSESGQDEGLGHDSEVGFLAGDSDPSRDSGVSMNNSDDNLSDVTVKVEPSSEVSDTVTTDPQSVDDGDRETPEVLIAHSPEADVSSPKDQEATSEAPEDVEIDSVQAKEAVATELEVSSSAEASEVLPQDEVLHQEPEVSEEPLLTEEDKSLPQEEVISQEEEQETPKEKMTAEEDNSLPQEDVISQDQAPAEEPLSAEDDDRSLPQEAEIVNQEQELAADPTPAEEDNSASPHDVVVNEGQEQPEEPVPTEEDDSTLPKNEVVGQEQELPEEPLPTDDLPSSTSDKEDDDHERPRTADKSTGPDEPVPISEPGGENMTASPESEPLPSTVVKSAVPDESQQDNGDFKPRNSRRDSSTQTEELWRPKTPFLRSVTPAIVLPDANDSEAKTNSRAKLSRTESRRSIQQAEELVAAAVIIRAAADTLGETSTRMTDAVKELKQHRNAEDALNVEDGGRGIADATRSLRDSSANRLTGVERTLKTDDKPARSPRQHRSSHGSRSSRPSTRESGSKRHSSHRHRHEGDREVEQGSPQTPPRTRDTADSGHRSRKERTPQEQADHDRRKEERRLAREKSKTDSPAVESKGKDVEAPPSIDRRSSRRHSSSRKENVPSIASTGRTESTAPPQASRKFFDKNGTSVVESFGGPLTTETSKDGSLKRSGSKSVRRSLSQNQAKLQKARVEESVKASKDKVDKERPRESRTISSATSNGNSSAKDRDDKHRKSRMEKREKEDAANGHKDEKKEKKSGGLKGMFKKLFG